jgi:PIN domain nuclease of toxin-antitoxin system
VRLLLDTHALLWWAHDPYKLSRNAYTAIARGDNDVFVSAVSAMEIATKSRKNKLEYESGLAHQFVAQVTSHGFDVLSIRCDHAERAGSYAAENQDPWDRLLAAQAQIEGLTLISCDERMPFFDVDMFW